jgi:threonine/homoserine efflux transporter RhtA
VCRFYRQYPYWNVAVLIWTIISIELTLIWNNIDDVHSISSTGQLIPFVTGVAGILKVFYVWMGQRIGESKVTTNAAYV